MTDIGAARGRAIVVRADAGSSIGIGHVVRSFALAEAWVDEGGRAIVVSAGPMNVLESMAHGCELEWLGDEAPALAEDALRFAEIARQANAFAAVIDSYRHDIGWERKVHETPLRLLAVDDMASRPHDCDLLVDTSIGADAGHRYRGMVPDGTTLLLGTSYILLRRSFRRRQFFARSDRPVRRVLISFGGTDPQDYTGAALEALALLGNRDITVDVVTSSANPHLPLLRQRIEGRARINLHVDTPDMAGLMAASDIAVGSAGSTSWERCRAGLPALAMVAADNQKGVLDELLAEDVVRYVDGGKHLAANLLVGLSGVLADGQWRARASRNAMKLVDGLGAIRVAKAISGAANRAANVG